jgi:NAD dependent epimerase/dehydratase family enzyme
MKNIETKKIVIAGGSGLLGKCIIKRYKSNNYQLIVLSRKHREDHDNVVYIKWDGKTIGEWANVLENADA